jgi:hypothetical protein
MDESTTRSLSDEDIETVMPGSASTVEERPRDEDATDPKDTDAADKRDDQDTEDSKDADATDKQDADQTDSSS